MRYMRATPWGRLAIAMVLTLATGAELRSQRITRDPDAAEVAALLRNQGRYGGAIAVLSQARGPEPQQKMDAIADSLVVIAVSFPGDDHRGASTRMAALRALLAAGTGESGVVGIERAVPYAGAADRLMQMAETAEDVGIRGTALWALTRLPNKAKLLPYLHQFATSRNRVAYRAVTLLARETGPEGLAMARELYRGGRVTERTAKETLDRIALANRWQ